MKYFPNFSEKKRAGVFITPSEVIEFLFCARFIYFMNCLNIPQHEEKRYKVMLGRRIHEKKKKINKEYFRKKLGCINKDLDVYMSSEKFHLKGVVDEVLFLDDNTLAPFDYKFAEYKDFLYKTHKIQSVLYGLLIKDHYDVPVNKGFVCYTRSKNFVKEISFLNKDFEEALGFIDSVLKIIQTGYFPKKTSFRIRCIDCCYRNICV